MNVAGVSYRQRELRELMKSKTTTAFFTAEIVEEPTNNFDPNAKMVICEGYHIGYIPKESVSRYNTSCVVEVSWWDTKSIYYAKIV